MEFTLKINNIVLEADHAVVNGTINSSVPNHTWSLSLGVSREEAMTVEPGKTYPLTIGEAIEPEAEEK